MLHILIVHTGASETIFRAGHSVSASSPPQEDEAKLAAECALVGQMLGCGEGAAGEEAGKPTLAKIVRGIASGAVRAHCERRERVIQVGRYLSDMMI